jgi:hypothetical protein
MKKLILMLVVSFVFAACSASGAAPQAMRAASKVSTGAMSAPVPMAAEAMMMDSAAGAADVEEALPESAGRKLITTGDLRVRVENLDEGAAHLSALMASYEAYASYLSVQDNQRYYSIRVPADSYKAMVDEVSPLGRVLNYSENIEDVTLRFYDLESRLETKRELLQTYRDYLAKAQSMADILDVEGKIADLQNEIDRMGTEFRTLTNQIDYATLNLTLLGPVAATSYEGDTIGERLADLFAGIGDTASTIVVVGVAILIYGIPALAVLGLLYWLLLGKVGWLRKLWKQLQYRVNQSLETGVKFGILPLKQGRVHIIDPIFPLDNRRLIRIDRFRRQTGRKRFT